MQFPLFKTHSFYQCHDTEKCSILSNQVIDFWSFVKCLEKLQIYKGENKHAYLIENGKTLGSFFSALKELVVYQDAKKIAECAELFRFILQPFNDLSCHALASFYSIDFTQFEKPKEAEDNLKMFVEIFRLLFMIAPAAQYPQIMRTYEWQMTNYQACRHIDAFEYFVGLQFSPAEFRQWCHNRTVVIPSAIIIEIQQLPEEIFAQIQSDPKPSYFMDAVGLTSATLTLDNDQITVYVNAENGNKCVEFFFDNEIKITHQALSPPIL